MHTPPVGTLPCAMGSRPHHRLALTALACALAGALALPARAEPPSPTDWKAANEAVGRMKRGHIDVLKWEKQNTPAAAPAPTAGTLTLEQATQAAWALNPSSVADPNLNPVERAQWAAAHLGQTQAVQRAYIAAVAARAHEAHTRHLSDTAHVGAELAQRMVQVGNWPEAKGHQAELLAINAASAALAAQQQSLQAAAHLWQLTHLGQHPADLQAQLPDRLPALPTPDELTALNTPYGMARALADALARHPVLPGLQTTLRWERRHAGPQGVALAQAALNEGAQRPDRTRPANRPWDEAWEQVIKLQAQVDALTRQTQADLTVAHRAWQTALTLRQQAQRQADLQDALAADMQRQYNGMFKTTWDLLAAQSAARQAHADAVQAQANAWLAQLNLEGVMQGQPLAATALAAPAGAAADTAQGH